MTYQEFPGVDTFTEIDPTFEKGRVTGFREEREKCQERGLR